MIFGDFNMRFINESSSQKYTNNDLNDDKTLKRLVKKANLQVGNSFQAENDDILIKSEGYMLADRHSDIPVTRYDGKGGGTTIDFIMWSKNVKNVKNVLVTHKNYVEGTDHVLLRAYLNDFIYEEPKKIRDQINYKRLKNKKFKNRYL